jgi:hypothetical protein
MPGLKENNISNGEVLAAVNKFITKNLEPHNSQIFIGYSAWFLYTPFVFKG